MGASARHRLEELNKWLNAQHQEKAIAHLARPRDARRAVAVGAAHAATHILRRLILIRPHHTLREAAAAGLAEL